MAALGMTMALSGCGSSSGSGDVTLKVVAADYGNSAANSSEKYWNSLAKEFESENPGIKVDVDVRSWKTVDADVAKMVRDGEAPDIAQIGAYADYVKKEELYSADELLSIPTQANFLSRFADAGKVDQTQYGMPFVASTRLLFYNKGLFAAAGLSAPQDWDDIKSDAEALKAQDVPTPFALPLGPEEAQAETMMWMLSGGGGYTDATDGSYAVDSETNVKTFEWLQRELVGEGLTGSVPPGELDRADAFKAFTDGKVGMLNGHPTMMQEAEKAGVDVGMVPLPGINGKSKATMGVADWIMAFKQAGHREQAGKFLDFTFEDENVMDFVGQYDLLPVTYSASETMVADDEHKELRKFLEALPTAELYPFGKTSWAGVSDDIKKNIGKTVQPGAVPSEILARIGRDATTAENAE
ncbi:extracellular solute-binding protein [Streptomyces sp. NP-1717]|uniref:extracellular solute-binding protein n=1 Tax=unclassified Streptomyces TaxID=2593676 RepID=UPI001F5DE487|nr:extracellular solute-binding protein [Streptomyces sp. NP-1717]MCI3221432.1 extracellular solute-binding protein [Streptomyces sp. NP-1717]WTA78255.1 extracellular solute-binding protein [Streptomyces sp. NBC_00838]